MTTTRLYVGISADLSRQTFRTPDTPTRDSHGAVYAAVIGPFRTAKAARLMRDFGQGNPHMQSVGDCERLARLPEFAQA